MGCMAAFPISVTVRNLVEMTPHQIASDGFQNSYIRAFSYLHTGKCFSMCYPGFFKVYFYKNYPQAVVVK